MKDKLFICAENGEKRMDADTISKNGCSSKNHKSRVNIFSILFLGVSLVVAGFIFSGCDKDEEETLVASPFDGVITAKVDKGETYSTVKRVRAYGMTNQGVEVTVAQAAYTNGGFTLTLPATPPNQIINSVMYDFDGPGIKISDEDARIAILADEIEGYSTTDGAFNYNTLVCSFAEFKGTESNFTYVGYAWVDRDVTIIGSARDSEDGVTWEWKARMMLKEGWNRVYITVRETKNSDFIELSTIPVGGLKWVNVDEYLD